MFKLYRQKDSILCGNTCLRMVCRHYGHIISENQINDLCPPTSEGISIFALAQTAKEIGFDTECVKCTNETLLEATKPIILFWNQNHYVVLYKISKKGYHVADPAKGLIKYEYEEFTKHWITSGEKGIALLLKPNQAFHEMRRESEAGKEHSIHFMFHYAKEYKK